MNTTRRYAANRIRQLRQQHGFSLEALGAAMPSRLTPSTISKLEKGTMALSADYILEIAHALGVSPLEVLLDVGSNAASYVPIIGADEVTGYLDGRTVNMDVVAIPATIEGTNLFAIEVGTDEAPRLLAAGFVVVDPTRRTLEDGGWFLVARDDSSTDFVQFQATPPAFLGATLSPASVEPVGSRPFTVLARVVYVGAALV